MIYLQLTTGRGPSECWLAVQYAVKAMISEADGSDRDPRDEQWDVRVSIARKVEDNSMIVVLTGSEARKYADSWIGTVLWVCPSPIRKDHKRKNWFIGVREIKLPTSEEIIIHEDDLNWEAKKASSKGGQNANKNANVIRLTHKPTGIVVVAEDERSQKQNKFIALGRLREALVKRQDDAIALIDNENWTQHNQLERGNPIRTYEGPDFVDRS